MQISIRGKEAKSVAQSDGADHVESEELVNDLVSESIHSIF